MNDVRLIRNFWGAALFSVLYLLLVLNTDLYKIIMVCIVVYYFFFTASRYKRFYEHTDKIINDCDFEIDSINHSIKKNSIDLELTRRIPSSFTGNFPLNDIIKSKLLFLEEHLMSYKRMQSYPAEPRILKYLKIFTPLRTTDIITNFILKIRRRFEQ